MRKNRTEVKSISDGSYIDNMMVASMTANINSVKGDVTFSTSIRNKTLYDENKTEVQKDIADFQAEVYAMI